MCACRVLRVTDELTIYHALDLKGVLLDAMRAEGDLELDLSSVAEIDGAGLQLLILIKREAQRMDKVVQIVAHSPAVRELIEFCNVAMEFGDPLVIPAKEIVN